MRIEKEDWMLLAVTFLLFTVIEIMDTILDAILGTSLLHSVLQAALFLILFLAVMKIFFVYRRRRTEMLIPDELMDILHVIAKEQEKGVLVNQAKLMRSLDVTKPTIRKRVEQLRSLGHIIWAEEGNRKIIRLTPAGHAILR